MFEPLLNQTSKRLWGVFVISAFCFSSLLLVAIRPAQADISQMVEKGANQGRVRETVGSLFSFTNMREALAQASRFIVEDSERYSDNLSEYTTRLDNGLLDINLGILLQKQQSISQTIPVTQVRVLSGSKPVPYAVVYRQPVGEEVFTLITDKSGKPLCTGHDGFLFSQKEASWPDYCGQLKVGEQINELHIGDRLSPIERLYGLDNVNLTKAIASTPKYSDYPIGLKTSKINFFLLKIRYLSKIRSYTSCCGKVYLIESIGQTLSLSLSPDNPVTVPLTISVEWDASQDKLFSLTLKYALNEITQRVYTISKGNFVLGEINVYYNREKWSETDIQIHSNNQLMPNFSLYYQRKFRGKCPSDQKLDSEDCTDLGTSITAPPPMIYHHEMGPMRMRSLLRTCEDHKSCRELDSHWVNYLLYLLNYHIRPFEKQRLSNSYKDIAVIPIWSDTSSNFLKIIPHKPKTTSPWPIPPLFTVTWAEDVEVNKRFDLEWARVYLHKMGNSNIVHLGHLIDGEIRVRGAEDGDMFCVYGLTNIQLGCKEITTTTKSHDSLVLNDYPTWQPEIKITPTSIWDLGFSGVQNRPVAVRKIFEPNVFDIMVTVDVNLTPTLTYFPALYGDEYSMPMNVSLKKKSNSTYIGRIVILDIMSTPFSSICYMPVGVKPPDICNRRLSAYLGGYILLTDTPQSEEFMINFNVSYHPESVAFWVVKVSSNTTSSKNGVSRVATRQRLIQTTVPIKNSTFWHTLGITDVDPLTGCPGGFVASSEDSNVHIHHPITITGIAYTISSSDVPSHEGLTRLTDVYQLNVDPITHTQLSSVSISFRDDDFDNGYSQGDILIYYHNNNTWTPIMTTYLMTKTLPYSVHARIEPIQNLKYAVFEYD